jgi:hypothetical protein
MKKVAVTAILHQKGGIANNWMFGTPWGDSLTPGTTVTSSVINLATLKGNGVTKFSDSFPTGTMDGCTIWKATGAGPITYGGIDITSGPVKIAHGTPLGGLLFKGTFECRGTGELEGIKVKGEYIGVGLANPDGTPTGINVVWGTAIYMLPNSK